MPNPYSEIFKAPGTKGFSAAGFVARLPLAMVTMGTVAMLSQTHGEYWLAGAVSATFALTNAIVSPQISRLVDRFGQSRVLIPATTVSVLSFLGLLAAAHFQWSTGSLFLFALTAAVMPSMPAMVRARWSAIHGDTPLLGTAFAFESVLDELVYMLGSVFAVGLSVAWFPEAGPLAATLFLAIGTFAFVVQRSTEPPIHPGEAAGGRMAIGFAPVQIIALTLIAIGAMFGTAEVTVIAFSEALGQKGAASFVLAGYATGSLIVGLIFGTLKPKMSLAGQFLTAVAFAFLAAFPLLIVGTIPMLTLFLFFSGASISPTFITAFALIERLIPPSKLTEGITWAMTGIGIGMATGSFVSGYVIDTYGAQSGFWVSVVSGGLAFLAALVGNRTLRAPARSVPKNAAIA